MRCVDAFATTHDKARDATFVYICPSDVCDVCAFLAAECWYTHDVDPHRRLKRTVNKKLCSMGNNNNNIRFTLISLIHTILIRVLFDVRAQTRVWIFMLRVEWRLPTSASLRALHRWLGMFWLSAAVCSVPVACCFGIVNAGTMTITYVRV